jgi:hypothetical protein
MGRLTEIFVAERPWERLVGLAGLPALPSGAALLIPRCRSVHTFGMRFPLDVLFVTIEDGSLVAHDARYGVPPRRVVRASPPARRNRGLAALELAAGFGLCDDAGARLEPGRLPQALGLLRSQA